MAYGDNRSEVASDTFDSSIGSAWSAHPDMDNMAWASGGYVTPTNHNADAGIIRNTGTYADDQYSISAIGFMDDYVGGGGDELWASVRQSGSNSACYLGIVTTDSTKYQIVKVTSGDTWTYLDETGTASPPEFSEGDTVTIEAEGTTLRIGTNEGSGDTQRSSTTDSAHSSGVPGCGIWNNNSAANTGITAWSGGNIGAGGASAISGTAAMVFGAGSSALTGTGALAGSAAMAFAAGSSTLIGLAPIAGTAAMTFAAGSSTLIAVGQLAGSADMTFGAGGSTLTGAGALAGSSAVVFGDGSSTLTGTGALAGTSAVAFSLTGSMAAGAMSGTAAMTFASSTGTLTGLGALAGSSALTMSGTATLHDASALSQMTYPTPSARGGGGAPFMLTDAGPRRRRKKDDEELRRDLELAFGVISEAPSAVVEQAREVVEQHTRQVDSTQRVTLVDFKSLRKDAEAIREVMRLYERAREMRLESEREDEILLLH